MVKLTQTAGAFVADDYGFGAALLRRFNSCRACSLAHSATASHATLQWRLSVVCPAYGYSLRQRRWIMPVID
ncbi:protein of unknown function [Methylorubrum extorquens DM4]|uniref:Uncharacterized protein n=1 Tax=Methylorubrum extorquens (strain DSM 6343 / CIP 106787 / DM4) TaxID=661410 RepID=C7CCG1_METED|nr:protein of unknown function [Methylorubrum extorquens DM4]